MRILVINSGSTSIKFQLRDMSGQAILCRGEIERIGLEGTAVRYESARGEWNEQREVADHQAGVRLLLELISDPERGVVRSVGEIAAVGHRIVHGGESIDRAELVTPEVERIIEENSRLAPLHNPANLMGIRAVRAVFPEMPQAAVFDTAFHATIPEEAFLFGLSYDCYREHGIRRFGFHGPSHRYVFQRTARMLGRAPEELNCVTCHMGGGVSLAAIRGGRSVDTSVGFGTVSGVPMGTRAGDVDPAAVLYLLEQAGLSSREVYRLLYHESGLKGLSGVSSDVREISAAAAAGNRRAELALRVFAHAARRWIAALATSLEDRLDALVFTAGIGVNAPALRAMICSGLGVIGVRLDPQRNTAVGREAEISAAESKVRVLVIPTDEEWMIAEQTRVLLSGQQPG
ncbi:MAG: acetate kinase [Spirochaetales bacterium]|nr:acetate kinase [Spirochaetales bacterium]